MAAAPQRFCRKMVGDTLQSRIDTFQRDFDFEPGWGWARVAKRPIEVIIAFGRYQELLDLQEEFEA